MVSWTSCGPTQLTPLHEETQQWLNYKFKTHKNTEAAGKPLEASAFPWDWPLIVLRIGTRCVTGNILQSQEHRALVTMLASLLAGVGDHLLHDYLKWFCAGHSVASGTASA